MNGHKILQYCLPQHFLSRLSGMMARTRVTWFKNFIIDQLIKRFDIDLEDCIETDPHAYACVSDFFTRALKPEARPIVDTEGAIACPADGSISQFGRIDADRLLQAKGVTYSLRQLLTHAHDPTPFMNGSFCTIYLSPRDYHRVHMPVDGVLQSMTYVPGKLFSVSQETTEMIPDLFAKNERLICLFETASGPMAVIFVGAMLVASIHTVWAGAVTPTRAGCVFTKTYFDEALTFKRGAELGHFTFGSTVILLFPEDGATFLSEMTELQSVKMGECIGEMSELDT